MAKDAPTYLAYMLRLWMVEGDDGPVWRVSLESPHTGERHLLPGLEALFTFLCNETRGAEAMLSDQRRSPAAGGQIDSASLQHGEE
jgi:hypothetical protein